MNGTRYWEAELANGNVYREGQYEWREVPKKAIIRLSLFFDGRRWDLTGKEAYFIKTRASMVPGIQESFRIERRTIGFYQGAEKVCYHVEEDTGRFSMEVINTNAG
jgi:hypothetical protein